MEKQNKLLAEIAFRTKRIDEFYRITYNNESGLHVPDNLHDHKAMQEFQHAGSSQRVAFDEMYSSDISLGPQELEE